MFQSKFKKLKKEGKGNRENAAQPISDNEISKGIPWAAQSTSPFEYDMVALHNQLWNEGHSRTL